MKHDTVLTLLRHMISSIVDTPAVVEFKIVETDQAIVYYVIPGAGEAGQAIGKKGILANAIRVVIKSAARRSNGKHVYLDILDRDLPEF